MPKTRSKKANSKESGRGKNLEGLLITKLSVLLDIEKELIKALPKLAKAATDKDLSQGFKMHLEETKGHAKRVEEALRHLGAKPERGMSSAGIRGIVEDGAWVIKNVKPKEARDANLIAAASYAEHYEMAGYVAAREWAKLLGHTRVAELLDQNLQEEVAADKKMSELGKEGIFEGANQIS
jgi:ferritin-like metal-binding protein YciE